MYARTAARPKPRQSQLRSFPAPTAGWISNRALAVPNDGKQIQGAAVLDNFVPRATSVVLRRGKRLFCTLGDGSLNALSLFSYNAGTVRRIFAATETTIYDITDVEFSTDGEIVDGSGQQMGNEDGDYFGWMSTSFLNAMNDLNGGDWIVVQFATSGGVFLIGVNGADEAFISDGGEFLPWVAGGVQRINFDAAAGSFTNGSTITGGTSGATGTIYRAIYDTTTTGTIYLTNVTGGPFVDDENVTDGVLGTAVVNGPQENAEPGIVFPDGLTIADMSYVWVYKSRVWFIQKNSLNAYYLDQVDAIGGTAVIFPMAGIFQRGGNLLFGQGWSLEDGAQGGLSEQNIFVTTEGEVAIYQGDFPGEADTWRKVGTYRIGKPLGNRAFIRGGGDLAIATSVGLVPLSKAISLDVTSLNVATVSYNIADAWNEAVARRGLNRWQGEVWPEAKIAVFGLPTTENAPDKVMFITNTETGAWSRFTNWEGLSLEVFDGDLYFGSSGGKVYVANSTGSDDGEVYTGAVMPLFEDFGSPASPKIGKVGRAVVRASTAVTDQVSYSTDFNEQLPAAPNATQITQVGSLWDVGVWGQSVWGAGSAPVITQDWRSIGGIGSTGSLAYQVSSGSIQPLDVELIRLDMLYEEAGAVT